MVPKSKHELEQDLKICSINIRGPLYTEKSEKITEVKKIIIDEDPGILFLNETELIDVDAKCPPRIENYITYCPNKKVPKTRILCLVREDVKHELRNDLMDSSNCSSIWVECAAESGQKTIVGGYYREWDDLIRSDGRTASTQNTVPQMAERFDVFLNQVKTANRENHKQIIFLGDLNLNVEKWKDEKWRLKNLSNKLQEELLTYGMTMPIFGSTRRREEISGKIEESALDIAATNKIEKLKDAHKSDWFAWTDHCMISVTVNLGMHKQKNQNEYYTARSLARIRNNPDEFNLRLRNEIPWVDLAKFEDVNDCVIFYSEQVGRIIKEMSPLRRQKVRKKPRVKLPPSVMEILNECSEVREEKRINPTPQVARKLTKVRGKRKKLVHREQMKYHDSLIKREGKPAIWKIINAERKGKSKQEKMKFTEDEVCDFFVNKVLRLDDVGVDRSLAIDPTRKLEEAGRGYKGEYLVLKTVQEAKVRKIIQCLKAKPSCGKDGISSELLKLGADSLAAPLTWIINKSIADKKFPDYWKEAIVKPLHKKGPKDNLKNFRPVSLLCVSGMILEAVIKEQLEMHLEMTKGLGSFQFGYRKYKSTVTAVTTMACKAKMDMNRGEKVAALMFDMSAAFDTVEKETVTKKLEILGVSKSAIEWVRSYLMERKQKVKIEDRESKTVEVKIGTPQGSRLSPLLFNILTCDLNLYMTNGLCCNFADDTSVSVNEKNQEDMLRKLESDADGMTTFTSSNNLVLNPGKTAFICKDTTASVKIGNSGTSEKTKVVNGSKVTTMADSYTQTEVSVTSEGDQGVQSGSETVVKGECEVGNIEERDSWSQMSSVNAVHSTELLGMKIQGDLKWDSHIKDLKKTLKQRRGVLARLKHLVPKESLKIAAEAIFTSKIRYGVAVYLRPKLKEGPGEGNEHLKELTKLQNDMLRTITGKKLSDHVTLANLRRQTGVMTVNQLCVYHILMETYSILKLGSSPELEKELTRKSGNPSIRLRSVTDQILEIPINYNKNNSFNYYAAITWNEFHKWLKGQGNSDSQTHSLEKECSLKIGLGMPCNCNGKFCKLRRDIQPKTTKEIYLSQQRENHRQLTMFKKRIRNWILEHIPQD